MFGLFGKKQPVTQVATVVFNEEHCHSAGNPDAQPYRLAKGITDLRFVFPDFEAFWQTYINRNPHLSNDSLIALRDGQAVFTISVVAGQEYQYHGGMNDDGTITLNAANLMAMGHKTPFPGFIDGALAFGLYHPGAFQFEVLWATVYTSD